MISHKSRHTRGRILVVDLNNYARYPTLSVGYLIAALREHGHQVQLLSPLAHGLPAVERERRETALDYWQRRVFFDCHPLLARTREALVGVHTHWIQRAAPGLLGIVTEALEHPYDAVLLSSYVDHRLRCEKICELASARGIPVLLGGPVFNSRAIANEWLSIPGLTALFGGEADLCLGPLVSTLISGGELTEFPGILLPNGAQGPPAPPLQELDRVPLPDFTDFPWASYPHAVIPLMTGRGCSWAGCTFCSDVHTASGRTFRSHSLENILGQMEKLSERHQSKDFIFLDIKLNSNLKMWRGLISEIQSRVPGARWIGTVHVQAGDDNGLSSRDLKAAYAAGLRRISFGLESGSQSLLESMDKGSKIDGNAAFLQAAHNAGISVRCTIMHGYPGETAADLQATIAFILSQAPRFDRIRLTRFKPIPGTRIERMITSSPEAFPTLSRVRWDHGFGRAHYRQANGADPAYRRATNQLLQAVHAINRRELRRGAEVFDGLM